MTILDILIETASVFWTLYSCFCHYVQIAYEVHATYEKKEGKHRRSSRSRRRIGRELQWSVDRRGENEWLLAACRRGGGGGETWRIWAISTRCDLPFTRRIQINKSTTATLRAKVSCSSSTRYAHFHVFFLPVCLSVGVATRTRALERSVSSQAIDTIRQYPPSVPSKVRLSRWSVNAIERREECAIAKYSPWRIRDGRRDYYRDYRWFSRLESCDN